MLGSNNAFMSQHNNITYKNDIQNNLDAATTPTNNIEENLNKTSTEITDYNNVTEHDFINNEEETLMSKLTSDSPDNESGSICKEQELNCFHNSLQHEIKLLKLLNNLGAPLYAYNEIMNWAQKASMNNFDFDTKQKTYHQVIQKMEDLLGMQSF